MLLHKLVFSLRRMSVSVCRSTCLVHNIYLRMSEILCICLYIAACECVYVCVCVDMCVSEWEVTTEATVRLGLVSLTDRSNRGFGGQTIQGVMRDVVNKPGHASIVVLQVT